MIKSIQYRPELDGLRALAVIAVFLYHAELTLKGMNVLPGGFLGVDVFFVLSGFLITGILLEKPISLWSFYKSRIDRIYPALLLMLFITCIAAYIFLVPKNLFTYIESLKGALGFYSNYVFMNEDSYVADASKYKPLIHTWTLGVEWQFYIAFPLIIIAIKKFFLKNTNEILIFLFFCSFFYCLYLMKINMTHAFYSTPSRVWELFLGGIVYLLSTKISPNKFDSYLSILGLSLIAYSLFFFKDTDQTPGFISLIAVIGTSLYILFTRSDSFTYKVMSFKPFVFIGIISYSLYLYHQPVLAFYRLGFDEVGKKSFILLFFISIGLAYLSYKFFENPIRRSKNKSKYLILILIILLISLFIKGAEKTDGYLKRYSGNTLNNLQKFNIAEFRALTDQNGKSCNHIDPKNACFFEKGGKQLVVVGDSYSGVFTRVLSEVNNISLRSFQYEQCPLLSTSIWFGNVPECWEINKSRWAELEKLPPSNMLIGTNFHQFGAAKKSIESFKNGETNSTDQISSDEAFLSFRQAIEKLIQLGHHPIILLQAPDTSQNVEQEIIKRVQKGDFVFSKEYNATSTAELDNRVIESLNGLNVDFINLNEKLCDENKKCLTFNETGGLYNGGSHLSYFGAKMFIEDIQQKLK